MLLFEVQEIVARWGVRVLGAVLFYIAVTWFSRRDIVDFTLFGHL